MEEIKSREQIISFMQEMTARFTRDHVPDLMKNRRVEECEALAEEYIQDPRFTATAEYLINEGAIDATVADFKTDEQMNIIMFFHCFDEYYPRNDFFNELYILSEEEYTGLVKSLATSKDEVARETAELLGIEDEDDIESYEYDDCNWHLTELTMGELIAYENPDDRCDEGSEDETEEVAEGESAKEAEE